MAELEAALGPRVCLAVRACKVHPHEAARAGVKPALTYGLINPVKLNRESIHDGASAPQARAHRTIHAAQLLTASQAIPMLYLGPLVLRRES
jgi:hypothetical protein